MLSNLNIDDDLLNKAFQLSKKKTKADAINEALFEYIKRRKKLEILDVFGTVEYFDDYDHKTFRNR